MVRRDGLVIGTLGSWGGKRELEHPTFDFDPGYRVSQQDRDAMASLYDRHLRWFLEDENAWLTALGEEAGRRRVGGSRGVVRAGRKAELAPLEAMRQRYEPRVRKFLVDVGRALRKERWIWHGEVLDLSDQSYQWAINVLKPNAADREDSVDVAFSIPEQQEHEPDSGEGISFQVDITSFGGEILGGLSPGNYGPDCWIPLEEEDRIEDRFRIFEDPDRIDEIVDLVLKRK